MVLYGTAMHYYYILYSWKYWRELNLAVGSQIAIANILVDLNLVVRYGIAIHMYVSKNFLVDFNLAVAPSRPPNCQI